MTSRLTTAACLTVGLAALSAPALAQQPARDAVGRPGAGTGAIGGVVVNQQDGSVRPVRRALVTLAGPGLAGGVQVATDDSGRFAFPDLPAGRFTLTAEKPAFVKTYYGSKRVGRGPGMPVALADGQRLVNLSVPLVRGAAIEGTVLDENNKPLSSAQVTVLQAAVVNGVRKLVNVTGAQWATTDDRGNYRLYGLPPGDYTVRASGGLNAFDVRLATGAAIDGSAVAPLVARSGAYFPGVIDATLAEFFPLAAGQERLGVDVRTPLVHPTRIGGTAIGPSGQPLRTVMIGLANASTGTLHTSLGGIFVLRDDGRFSVTSLTPGRYLFFGRGIESGQPGDPSLLPLWASEEIAVNEQDYLDLVLRFLPGVSVSGRLAFSGSQPAPDMTRLRIALTAVPAIAGTAYPPPAVPPQPDGSFSFSGVPPGKYRISVTGGGAWSLRSAMAGERDTLDQPLEVLPGQDFHGIAVTLTDRPTTLAGTLFDQLGRPSPDYSVVVFSTNRAHWTTAPRRVSGAVRAGSDGRFSVVGLPPGEYFLTALPDVDPSQLAELAFLDQLAATAMKVTLAEGETKTQDLTMSGGG
jgi:hypothetical protein